MENTPILSDIYQRTKKEYFFEQDSTIIEGPLPVCSKIFSKNHLCDISIDKKKNEKYSDYGKLQEFTFHENKFTKNKEVIEINQSYHELVEKEGSIKLFTLTEQMKPDRTKEILLGNFISDIIREITNSGFTVLNSGLFRKDWNEGDITVKDLLEMFPFSNTLVMVMK